MSRLIYNTIQKNASGNILKNASGNILSINKNAKYIVDLDASKGKIFGSGINIESWHGKNSEIVISQTVSGSQPTYDNGEQALYFNGDHLIEPVQNTIMDFGTGEFTIEFWMKASAIASFYSLMGTFWNTGWLVQLRSDGTIQMYMEGASDIWSGSYPIIINTWAHVLIQRQGTSALSMFKDGLMTFDGAGAENVINAVPFSIGKNIGSVQNYNGFIDKPKIIKNAMLGDVSAYSVGEQVFQPIPR